ncbi:MAG: DUF1599 domain-containing protein [Bacteroidales bacterium]|nr:DUF1599 domain-containing protein [Bacteroidales bacterium]
MANTSVQYDNIIKKSRDLFVKKMKDYGTSWRILRLSSLTDQIFIKAKRIRSIQQSGVNLVGDNTEGEFIAIVNYGIMALIQCELGTENYDEIPFDRAEELYDKYAMQTKDLMLKKNHDYGEAWRDMRISSMTDIILQKILRLKQIEDNAGKTIVSEGPQGSYTDIINYAVFCLIRMDEENSVK